MSSLLVKFSRVSGDPVSRLLRVGWSFRKRGLHLRTLNRLKPSYDAFDGGLDLDGDGVECDDLDAALKRAETWENYALTFGSKAGYVDVYIFGIDETGFCITVGLEFSVVSYHTNESDPGQWMWGLLSGLVTDLQVLVCGYGRDNAYNVMHEALDPAAVVARLRRGDLFVMAAPTYHAISLTLVGMNEMEKLLADLPKNERLRHGMFGQYQMIWRIPY